MEIRQNEEKFSPEDIAELRTDLLQSGLDTWQAAELITSFLSTRGYGLSSEGARKVATRIDAAHCNLDCVRAELERVALVM